MDRFRAKVVLWIGPKHSGKSTAAQRLVERAVGEGFSVAGILAPALYQDGTLVGFDVVNIATGRRRRLARRTDERSHRPDVGRFAFCPQGLRFGNIALRSPAARVANLVVVDEFGPLELRGGGWRHAIDELIAQFSGTLLLVVRAELAGAVAQVYAAWYPERIAAAADDVIPRLCATSGKKTRKLNS